MADLKTNWVPGESGLVSAVNTGAAKVNELAALTDSGRLSDTQLSAKIGEQVAADVPPAVADALADDDTVAQAAVAAVGGALAEGGVVTSDPAAPAEGEPLILAGADDALTWLQARGEVDADLGLALPTAETVKALSAVGLLTAMGLGEDILIDAGNGNVVALLVAFPAAPPADLDLEPGAVRLYINDGEPVLAVGS